MNDDHPWINKALEEHNKKLKLEILILEKHCKFSNDRQRQDYFFTQRNNVSINTQSPMDAEF